MLLMTILAGVGYTAIMLYYPEPMLNPGDLILAHQQIDNDCFACHSAFRGITRDKCVTCHRPEQIGLFKVDGTPMDSTGKPAAFHRQLEVQPCAACHLDHLGRHYAGRTFSHDVLPDSLKSRCEQCHSRPSDRIHRVISASCVHCHDITVWKPARFDHAVLDSSRQMACTACHNKPEDALHRLIDTACGHCHTTEAWKPATYDHDRYFRFDKDHRTECATCHTKDDFRSYSCYGCHEHSPAKIREEHEEEGISDYQNCVRCHRSGNKHEVKKDGRDRHDSKHKENDD